MPLGDDVLSVVLSDSGHIIPQHRPDRLTEILLNFLR